MGCQSSQIVSTMGHMYICNMCLYPFLQQREPPLTCADKLEAFVHLLSYPHRILFGALWDFPPLQVHDPPSSGGTVDRCSVSLLYHLHGCDDAPLTGETEECVCVCIFKLVFVFNLPHICVVVKIALPNRTFCSDGGVI